MKFCILYVRVFYEFNTVINGLHTNSIESKTIIVHKEEESLWLSGKCVT